MSGSCHLPSCRHRRPPAPECWPSGGRAVAHLCRRGRGCPPADHRPAECWLLVVISRSCPVLDSPAKYSLHTINPTASGENTYINTMPLPAGWPVATCAPLGLVVGLMQSGLCSTQLLRADSTLTHVTIQVTQL